MEPTLIIKGDPEYLEMIVDTILGMASDADTEGRPEIADAIAAMLPELRIMKAAQYEGFQNYWLANGRAFELSFKHKLEEDGGKDESFHDAWFDTLQDYTESLMTDQSKFLSKNLKTAQYEGFSNHWLANSRAFELAFKHNLEKQGDGEESFHDAWFDALDDFGDDNARDDFLKHLKTAAKEDHFMATVVATAARGGVTVAQAYREWEGLHFDAMRALLRKVASKVEEGASPGVAFYETINYYASGTHAKDTIVRIAKEVKPLSKGAGFLGDVWNAPRKVKEWGQRQLAKPGDWLRGKGDVTKAFLAVQQAFQAGNILAEFEATSAQYAANPKMWVLPRFIEQKFGPFLTAIDKFYAAAEIGRDGVGSLTSQLDPFPDPANFANAENGGLGKEDWEDFAASLGRLIDPGGLEKATNEFESSKDKYPLVEDPATGEMKRTVPPSAAQPKLGVDALQTSFNVFNTKMTRMFKFYGPTLTSASFPANAEEIIQKVLNDNQFTPGMQVNPSLITSFAELAANDLTEELQANIDSAMGGVTADKDARNKIWSEVEKEKKNFDMAVKSYVESKINAAAPQRARAPA